MSNDRLVLPPPDVSGSNAKRSFVSRAGLKLEAALLSFPIDVTGKTCADLGANVGGFTDCLLQHGAAKVYSVDTAYGILAWTLRKDPRVIVKERMNALHVKLPEPVSIVSIDVGWTRQNKILPVVAAILADNADVLTLIKPHYESEEAKIQKGVLTPEQSEQVLHHVLDEIEQTGWRIHGVVRTPIEGQKGNTEYIAWLRR
ncbi:MAG TPA: SAM-dependent methyltransferase [Phycisphaerae bacterium]|nr:SAM-dependent methyltransferase [Phycisphaerae bacterium]